MANMLVGSALADWAGPLKDLMDKGSGSEAHVWLHALKRMLRKENPWEGIPLWRTIKIGTGLRTARDFLRALNEADRKIGDWADDLLGVPQFVVATEEGELDLAVMTTKQLTGKIEATYAEICAEIIAFGGQLCPPETGPQLRLQYENQPEGEFLFIAMEAIPSSSDAAPSVFYVGRLANGLYLRSSYSFPGDRWLSHQRWVFVIPRK